MAMYDVRIMDIAMNLARIGNWAANDFEGKEKRINMFLEQTNAYLRDLDVTIYSESTKQALARFSKVFNSLRTKKLPTARERLLWADAMFTWSNILTHKAKLK